MQGKYQKFEALLGRLLISILVFVGTFMVLEAVSRTFFSARPPIEQLFPVQRFRHPRPYSMFAGKPFARELNSLGYKGSVPEMPKNPEEYRIFFLGGSTVYVGRPPISSLVEELFHQHGRKNVKAYNLGVVSSVSGMELARLLFEVSDLTPDLVVMYNGGNDILQPWSWDPRPGYPFNFIAYENNPLLDKDIESYPALSLFFYGSNIMRKFFRGYFLEKFIPLEQVRAESKYKSHEWKQRIAGTYISNLVKADKISKAIGSDLVAFFQPLIYFKNNLSAEEQHFFNHEEAEYAREMRQMILSDIDGIKDGNQIHIIDLSGIYEGKSNQIFTDSIHTKQEAKPIIAQAIYNRISDILND